MKRLSAFLIAAVICASGAAAGTPQVQATVAKDKESEATDQFSADVPRLYAFFKTAGTKKGDKLRGVWMAEEAGDAAAKETKVDESTLTADQDDFTGAFSLSKPTTGWPLGEYHLQIYVGNEVATTVSFEIKAAGSERDSDEDADDEVDEDSSD